MPIVNIKLSSGDIESLVSDGSKKFSVVEVQLMMDLFKVRMAVLANRTIKIVMTINDVIPPDAVL